MVEDFNVSYACLPLCSCIWFWYIVYYTILIGMTFAGYFGHSGGRRLGAGPDRGGFKVSG